MYHKTVWLYNMKYGISVQSCQRKWDTEPNFTFFFLKMTDIYACP